MNKMLLISLALIGGVFLWCYAHMEAYCFFYPAIDTRFAVDYSEQAFSQVSSGMTAEVVQGKLGTPLYSVTHGNGTVCWGYTDDGKCKWEDWAWMCRQVYLRDGRVEKINNEWRYD
jgi:outer membrane protein assembly factor BamE (lipoprotein component of BamABCDE complex)